MTNEEVKGRLESFIDTFNICKEHDNALVAVSISKEDIQAFTQAIKALETVSCIKEKCAYCPHCENCDVDDETLEIKALEEKPCNDWYDVPSDEMTLEQARQAVKDLRKKLAEYLEQQPCEDAVSRDCDKCAYYDDGANDEACDGCFADEYEHPNFKPKAQHYEDCISRQAVDELSKELVHTTRDKADFLCNFWEGLQKLPPVTPKEKTGHWIYKQGIFGAVYCSKCDFELKTNNTKYCPNCGARMVSE
ncbi:MAG: hypothetical protein IKN54_00240 [Lachnospiraceae bacterium]|nr:hypothetical protein [Lachnospiraceae bacterium]